MSAEAPIVELRNVSKRFGSVIALEDISLQVRSGEVCCLLGDNGAGKSTLIKILSGVHLPDEGEMLLDGRPVRFSSPRDALDRGIATVYQDLATVPLMSIMRNFFMGREPVKGWGPWQRFDRRFANVVTDEVLDPEDVLSMLEGFGMVRKTEDADGALWRPREDFGTNPTLDAVLTGTNFGGKQVPTSPYREALLEGLAP